MNSSRLILTALLFAFSAVSYFDRTIMSIAGPVLIQEFHLSPTEMGSVYSAFVLGYGLLMIPGGWLTDRLGPWRTLLIMGASSAILTGMTIIGAKPGLGSILGIVPALFLIRLGLGFVTAPLYPACARATANWIPLTQHARVQGIVIAGSTVGAAISPVLFVWLMARFGWRWSFATAALGTAALTALWYVSAREYPDGQGVSGRLLTRPPARRWSELFGDRNLQLITFAYAGLGYFQYIFFYWIYYYFDQVRHLEGSESARYTTILFVTGAIMMPLGGLVSDRITRTRGVQVGRRIVPMVALTLSAACVYVVTISNATTFVVFFLSLAFGFAACCEGPFWACLTDTTGENVGAASSILNTGGQIGGFFSPILTPYIATRLGWSSGLYIGSLFAILGVVAVYFVKLRELTAAGDSRSVGEGFPADIPS